MVKREEGVMGWFDERFVTVHFFGGDVKQDSIGESGVHDDGLFDQEDEERGLRTKPWGTP